jgi:glycogen synthase
LSADDSEIETLKKTDASIRWVNDCEYVLLKLHPKNRAEEKKLLWKSWQLQKNSYTFEFGMVGSDAKQKGVTKITD